MKDRRRQVERMITNTWKNTERELGEEKYVEERSEKKKKEKIVEIPEVGKIRKKK
jgi:hypothetical protein